MVLSILLLFIFLSLIIVSYFTNFFRICTLFIYFLIFLFIFNFMYIFNKLILGYYLFNVINHFFILNVTFYFFFDPISLFFSILSVFLIFFCLLTYWFLSYRMYLYIFILWISLIFLFCFFNTLDLYYIYIFFESIIIPIFLLIGIWGLRERKIYASYLFFFYTMVSSLFILIGILTLHFTKGSANILYYTYTLFSYERLYFLFLLFFIGFSVKVPVIPIHIWLPEAHVEAPTVGSILLAGILLKLGTYVYLRLLVSSFNNAIFKFLIFIWILSLFGLIISSMSALSQIDIKKIVAYSSIAHMNFLLFGLFSNTFIGISGSFFLMLGHAIVSSAFFFSVGALYDRYKTRLLFYYGGLVLCMPIYAVIVFVCVLANLGFPGTINFIGEFLILVGTFLINNFIILIVSIILILTLFYSLFFFSRVFFGPIRVEFIRYYCDLTRREFYIIFPFFICIILFGLVPNLIFDINFLTLISLFY